MGGAGDTKINEKKSPALGRKPMSPVRVSCTQEGFADCLLWVSPLLCLWLSRNVIQQGSMPCGTQPYLPSPDLRGSLREESCES